MRHSRTTEFQPLRSLPFSCCLNLFIRFASHALLMTIVKSADARKRRIHGTERDNAGAGDRWYACVLHRACGCTGRPDPQCARHSRRVRDDSVSLLSIVSGDFPGSVFLSFFLIFSLSLFFFLVNASHNVTCERDFQICQRVSRESGEIRAANFGGRKISGLRGRGGNTDFPRKKFHGWRDQTIEGNERE